METDLYFMLSEIRDDIKEIKRKMDELLEDVENEVDDLADKHRVKAREMEE